MNENPLVPDIVFWIGPVPIDRAVVTTWVIMTLILTAAVLAFRRPAKGGAGQTALEIVVETIADQLREILRRNPWPFMPLIGTLFIFLAVANLAAIVPGGRPPTGTSRRRPRWR